MNDISIIGGGLSGLYFAFLMSKNNTSNVHVYEKLKHYGGRIKSHYNKKGELLYECGPWRISKHHVRVLNLVKDLALTLEEIKQPIEKRGFKTINQKSINSVFPNTNQLTEYQYRCIKHNSIEDTNYEMMKSGYDLLFERANTTRSYSLHKTHEEEDEFFVVQEGFSKIIEKLVNILENRPNVHFHNESQCHDIKYDDNYFTLCIQKRVDSKTFTTQKKKTKYVVMALPPHEIKRWKSLTLEPNVEMVDSYPLVHVYGKVKNFTKENKKYICNSPISQVIQSCYKNDWIQLSYSGGRFAELLQNLQIMGQSFLKKYIKTEFQRFFPTVTIHKIVPHFWRNAVHFWKPNLKTTEEELKKKCCHPHAKKYPNLFWIGESISSSQGWMEGALETAEDVFHLWNQEKKRKKKYPKDYKYPKEFVIYDERILNVEKWKHIHPGGKELIENHMGEDITELWKMYHSEEISRYFPLLEE